jgi:ABC-type Mn2+/Zn2+ transport system permease subunit
MKMFYSITTSIIVSVLWVGWTWVFFTRWETSESIIDSFRKGGAAVIGFIITIYAYVLGIVIVPCIVLGIQAVINHVLDRLRSGRNGK